MDSDNMKNEMGVGPMFRIKLFDLHPLHVLIDRAAGAGYRASLFCALAFTVLYIVSRYNYNLFHGLADIFAIVIASTVFVVAWNSRQSIDNNYLLYAGIAFLSFAFLDLFHVLGNKNMGVFPKYGNLGPTLYIASRYVLSISLVTAPLFINRKLRVAPVFAAYSLVTLLVLLSVFYWHNFPVCFVEGVGLTTFKVVSDYIICLILLAALAHLLLNRRSFDARVLRLLSASILLSVATGLAFTLYTDPFGVMNAVGHFFQIISFYLIYLAVIETGLTKPQSVLFRKLRQSEEKFRNLFNNAGVGMFRARLDGAEILDANESFLKIFGRTKEEVLGKPSVIHWADPHQRDEMVRRLKANGRVVDFECKMVNKNGEMHDCIVSLNAYREEGVLEGAIWNITERKRAEEVLRQFSEELEQRVADRTAEVVQEARKVQAERQRFLNMLDTLPVVIDIIRADHRIEWANRSYRQALGDNVGRLCYESQFGCETPCQECQAFTPLQTGQPHHWEWTLPNGHTFDIYNFPFAAADGSPAILEMDIDITEQRQAEAVLKDMNAALERRVDERTTELRASEQRYRGIVETADEGIATHEPDGTINYVNQRMADMLGYSCEEIIGRSSYDFVDGEEREAVKQSRKSLKEQGSFIKERKMRRKDGSTLWTLSHVSPRRDGAGSFVGYLAMHTDITERKRAEEALKTAYNELELRVQERTSELSEAIERLRAENIARKQLEATLRQSEYQVRFFASQCLTAQETERKRVAGELHDGIAASLGAMKFKIEKVAEEMKRGDGTLESLQELSSNARDIMNEVRRIMADLRPSILDDLGIVAAMNWFCREYQKTYSQISVENQIGISEQEVPDSLKTPIFRICQEAMNNIAKYSKASLVTLSLRKNDDKIQLKIRDNGQGLDLNAVRKGLGLSTMRERAQLSGGSFQLESAKGKGTTVYASWPLHGNG